MEMETIEVETKLTEKAGPSDEKKETKTDDSKEYCKLKGPSDAIYAEATFVNPPPKEQQVKPSLMTCSMKDKLMALCIILGIICLAELITILILYGRTPPAPVCPSEVRGLPNRASIFPCSKKAVTKSDDTTTHSTSNHTTSPHISITPAPDSHRCPSDWLFFGNSCFFISSHRANWADSRRFCKSKSGDLVVISNQKIQQFLLPNVLISSWIGTVYNAQNNVWSQRRPTDGVCELLVPDNPSSSRNEDCSSNTFFICERQAY